MLNVLGQSRAVAQLQRAIRAGRLGHTWIFAGPLGVGKFRLAIELARVQMCDAPQNQPNTAEDGTLRVPTLPAEFTLKLACGVCESCRAIDAASHPDLHVVTKELIRFHDKTGKSKGTTLSINVIRGEITGDDSDDHRVEPKIYKRPFRGRGKWFLIDEADLMEVPAQNSLLKTLEEPPEDSYLVMITTSPQELLSTIRSRSQVIAFQELPAEVLVRGLIGKGLPLADAQLLARLARGSLGKALRWADDMAIIAEKNAAAVAKQKAKESDEDETASAFTPGGMLGWAKKLAETLDALVTGRAGGSDVAKMFNELAAEYADLQLVHDPLTSKDRAVRDGLGLLLGMAAEWWDDRLRQSLGVPAPTPLPAASQALEPQLVRQLVLSARTAESQIDLNVHTALMLATLGAEWEEMITAHAR